MISFLIYDEKIPIHHIWDKEICKSFKGVAICQQRKKCYGYYHYCLFIACGDDNTDIPDWPWAEPETPTEPVEANPDIVNLGWTNVKSTYGTLPEHINVYKSPETLEGKKAIAYIAVGDMSKAAFGVLGEKTGLKKPKNFMKRTTPQL